LLALLAVGVLVARSWRAADSELLDSEDGWVKKAVRRPG